MAPKLLLLITDLEIGGTPTVVRELAVRLNRSGAASVEVGCLSKWGPVADQLAAAGIPVTALGARGPADLRILPRLVRLIGRRQIDTVLSFLVHANAVAAAASRFSRSVRFFQSIQTTQPNPRWHWKVQALAARAAERVIVPSKSVAAAARERSGIADERLVVIPNAIDPEDWAGTGRWQTLRVGEKMPIGFIGRLDPVKRIGDLIDAIGLLPAEVELHIFGEGAQRGDLERQIAAAGLARRVTLLGAVSSPREALSRVAVLVLPSEAEGFGLVLIEAMAAGVPVVATDVPGICDVIRHGRTGLLVPPARPSELAAAIRATLDDPAETAARVQRGVDDVRERFTWERVLPQYVRLLEAGAPNAAHE